MVTEAVKADTTEVTLKLAREVVIRGRLLTPSGMPAAGVRSRSHGVRRVSERPGLARHACRSDTDRGRDSVLLASVTKN